MKIEDLTYNDHFQLAGQTYRVESEYYEWGARVERVDDHLGFVFPNELEVEPAAWSWEELPVGAFAESVGGEHNPFFKVSDTHRWWLRSTDITLLTGALSSRRFTRLQATDVEYAQTFERLPLDELDDGDMFFTHPTCVGWTREHREDEDTFSCTYGGRKAIFLPAETPVLVPEYTDSGLIVDDGIAKVLHDGQATSLETGETTPFYGARRAAEITDIEFTEWTNG